MGTGRVPHVRLSVRGRPRGPSVSEGVLIGDSLAPGLKPFLARQNKDAPGTFAGFDFLGHGIGSQVYYRDIIRRPIGRI